MSVNLAAKSAILLPRGKTDVDGVLVIVCQIQNKDKYIWNVSIEGTGENLDYPRKPSPLMYEFSKHRVSGVGIRRSGKNCGIPIHDQYLKFEAREIERTYPGHSEEGCRVLKLFVHCVHGGKATQFIMPTGAWMRQSDYERRKAALSKKYTNGIWYPKSNWV